jgi:hypothetical protein
MVSVRRRLGRRQRAGSPAAGVGRKDPKLKCCGSRSQKGTVSHDDTTLHRVYDGNNVSDGGPADLTDSTARAPIANLNEEEKNHERQTLF